MPTTATHLDDNAASELVSGSLSPAAVTRIEAHLAGCRDCRALVAALAADGGTDSNAATVRHERESPSQVAARPTRTLAIGDRVGRYLVLTALGAGGMGVVFAAFDPQLNRKVALKLLRAGRAYNTQDARTRLRREAQAIAQLSHPNVVAAYDVGATDDGDLYIAMEFVEGDTLTQWLAQYPRTWREIVDVYVQAARGLIAAHSVGLLHRDFKPDNVLVGHDGRVRVTDFGLARSLIGPDEAPADRADPTALDVALTATGTVLGTPRYMAPEQLTGPAIDARADQFAFCVALSEALYGRHPLPGATAVAMLEQNAPALPPPDGTKVPAAIARVVQRGLERDRARRYPTMAALIAELIPPPPRTSRRQVAAALIVLLVLGGAIAAVATRPDEPAQLLDEHGEPVSAIGPLVERLNELTELSKKREAENRALIAELARREPDAERIRQLRDELAAKDDKIVELQDALVRSQVAASRRTTGSASERRGPLIRSAFVQAHGELESCFAEWSKREAGDADLHLRMTVAPDGRGSDVVDLDGSALAVEADRLGPSLRMCVAAAIGRVRFPPGNQHLDLEVTVQWAAAAHAVNVAAHVTSLREATQPLLD